MKVALYSRVSTVDKNQDPEMQLRDLRTYANAREWEIYDEYTDIGQSGSKEKRPELNRLIDDAKKRKFDGIFVWRLDRFGRSLKHLINTLDELKSIGVNFVSYSENLDFSTATGQLLFHLLGAFAEFERNLTRERVKAGIANAKAKGKRMGRRPVNKFLAEKIRDLRAKGLTIRKIAKKTGLSPSCVHKTLSNLEMIDKDLSRDPDPKN